MNKELLNKILPYCGHGLKAIYEEDVANVCVSTSGTHRITAEHLVEKSRDGTYHWKPILFPPDCFTREIETEYGKEVPLIEIAKIAFPMYENWKVEKGIAKNSSIHIYSYNYGVDFTAYQIIRKSGRVSTVPVINQWQIFQYLYSRHIAFNLEPDEYISVKSLEKNPYAE